MNERKCQGLFPAADESTFGASVCFIRFDINRNKRSNFLSGNTIWMTLLPVAKETLMNHRNLMPLVVFSRTREEAWPASCKL